MSEDLKAPEGLGERGAALWTDLHAQLDFLPWEETVVVEACRCADTLQRLAESDAPLVQTNRHGEMVASAETVEARQQQQTLIRLLASLRLPTEVDEFGALTGGGRPQRRGAARGSYGLRGIA